MPLSQGCDSALVHEGRVTDITTGRTIYEIVVSEDRVAHQPGEVTLLTQPGFAAIPNQSLFAGGRDFFFTGHIAFYFRV